MQHGQQQQQLKYLYALGKCVIKTETIIQKQEQVKAETQTPTTQYLLENPCSTLSTLQAAAKTQTSASYPSYFTTFSTILPNCKHLTTSASLNHSDSCSTPPSSSAFSTWYSLTSRAPAFRILNELYGVIFMTLLVLSICHNNGKFSTFFPLSIFLSLSGFVVIITSLALLLCTIFLLLLQPTTNKL